MFEIKCDLASHILAHLIAVFNSMVTSICFLITGTERSQGMQALAISTNSRYLAVSECGEKATITVFDLEQEQNRRRKVLTGGEMVVDEFVCMAFSPDSKYLIGQAGGPNWTLFLWMWEKKKVIATVNISNNGPINQVNIPIKNAGPEIAIVFFTYIWHTVKNKP